MTYLFLIRHGETEWTKVRRFQGSTNTLLTANGKKQAKAVGKHLKQFGIDVLYSSPLTRARQTAAAAAKVLKLKPRFDKRLQELGFGAWEGKSPAELLKDGKSGYHGWCRGKVVTPLHGEKIPVFRKRVRSFLKEVTRKHRGQKIAVITHGGPVKMFLFETLKLPTRSLWSFRADTASLTVIGVGKHFSQAFCLNDTSYLPLHLKSKPEYL